jgi:hypothetical protein
LAQAPVPPGQLTGAVADLVVFRSQSRMSAANLSAQDFLQSMPGDWGVDRGYLNSCEGRRHGQAVELERQNDSMNENLGELLFAHIRAQFGERGNLLPGRGEVEHQGDDMYSFANIAFRYDSEGTHMPYMFSIIHFPQLNQIAGAPVL